MWVELGVSLFFKSVVATGNGHAKKISKGCVCFSFIIF